METLAIPAVILVTLTAVILLGSSNWRSTLVALAVQYVGVFVLVAIHWPLEMAVVKLIAGWMAGAVLGMAVVSAPLRPAGAQPAPADGSAETAGAAVPIVISENFEQFPPTQRLFLLLAALLVALVVLALAPGIQSWVPGLPVEQAWGSLILVGMGLLQLGFTGRPFRTVLGLLTVLSGFEVLYAALEVSTLVAGMLAAVNLGLALAGSYLLLSPIMEENE